MKTVENCYNCTRFVECKNNPTRPFFTAKCGKYKKDTRNETNRKLFELRR